jgi:type I restriction enzyme, S subunit
MSKLNKVYLKDIADTQTGPFGTQLHEKDYVSVGTPIVTVEHLGEIGFNNRNLPLVSEADKLRLSKYTLKEGDIVFSRVGSVDRCTYVSEKENGWMFSGRCLRVRFNEKANAKYISFYFRQKHFKEMMMNISVGATMPSLNTSLMANIPLYLPKKEDQQKIASVLSALDSKIELNNRINAELEAMAKTLYNYWFVQFNFPDENGKPYKTSGGAMVWNKELKREIPEGWEVKALGKEIEIQRGISYTSKDITGEGIPMINLNSFNLNGTYKSEGVKTYSGKYTEKNVVKSGDLLIAATDVTRNADIIGRAILVPDYYNEDLVFSMDIAKIISKNIPSSFLMMLFNSNHYHNYIKWYATGTLVLHLNLDGINRYNTELPPAELLKKFNEFYLPIAKRIYMTVKENQNLSQLRDWLLPMLMNGQVKVI